MDSQSRAANADFWQRMTKLQDSRARVWVAVEEVTPEGILVTFDHAVRPRRGLVPHTKCGALLQLQGGAEGLVGREIAVRVWKADALPVLFTAGTSLPSPSTQTGSGRRLSERSFHALKVGQLVCGTVQNVQPGAAFLRLQDAGGATGYLSLREFSGQRVASLKDHLAVGQVLKAKVLRMHFQLGHFYLSTKAVEKQSGDMITHRERVFALAHHTPASTASAELSAAVEALEVGQVVTGCVTCVRRYGAVVDLGTLSALLHTSNTAQGQQQPPAGHGLAEGQRIQAVVLSKDPQRGQVMLSTRALATAEDGHEGELRRGHTARRSPEPDGAEPARAADREDALTAEGPVAVSHQVGQLVGGVVRRVGRRWAAVELSGSGGGGCVIGSLRPGDLSSARVYSVADHLMVGQHLKVVVMAVDAAPRPPWSTCRLATRPLEATPGDMLHSPQQVLDGAEEVHARGVAAAAQLLPLLEALQVGQAMEGVVLSVQKYGVLVGVGGGLHGLVHATQLPPAAQGGGGGGPDGNGLVKGQHLKVIVLGKDLQRGRLQLSAL